MNINLIRKSLMTIALLSVTSSVIAADIKVNNGLAPKVSMAESKLSFWRMPSLKNAFIDTSPEHAKDDIRVGELGIDSGNKSGDKNAIVRLAKDVAAGKFGKYDSLLISHKNKLVFESYYNRGRINLPHFQSSVTKSFLSLAIGRAVQLGHLKMADLNKPIVSLVKDLNLKKLASGTENITLHQVMSMGSGIRVSADSQKRIMQNSSKVKGTNITEEFLQHTDAISPKSQSFKYQDSDVRITMQILDSVVPGSAKEFINNELLAKVGITNYIWENDVNGLPIAESTANLTSRDMLKLGSLVLNKGKWNDEQLVSTEFLANATSGIIKPTEDWIPASYLYGYYWYQTDMKVGQKSYDAKFAWGAGDQYIITIEALDLIVVITGHDAAGKLMAQVSKRILPAFIE